MKRINKKGFTLIELLAVIVILGVVMAIAIPSMNKVIDNSKKDTLVATAQEYINGAKTMLLSANSMPDYGYALVLSVHDIELERGGKSPYTSTEFDKTNSYVVVVNESDVNDAAGASDYTYYITLKDSSLNCLNPVTEAQLNNKAKVTRGYVASGTACESTAIDSSKTGEAFTTATTALEKITIPSGAKYIIYE